MGRRVERLLLAGIALIALVLFAFYLASAARHYVEDRVSQGVESLALLIEGDDKVLQRFYDLESQRQKLAAKKKQEPAENFYAKALEDKVARASMLSGTDAESLRAFVSDARPPAELVKSLRERKKALDDRPTTVAGVVMPSSTLGTRLPAAFVANTLIVLLAPLIMLWLAALRASRTRELAAATQSGDAYPHALNADELPFEGLLDRYARQRWSYVGSFRTRATLRAFFRMALLALLVVPVIAGYIGAVTTLGMGKDASWLRALFAVVVIGIMIVQAAAVLLNEAPAPDVASDASISGDGPLDDEPQRREEPRMTIEE